MQRKHGKGKEKKLRVVFDTNVFVSAALGGKGGKLLFELWKKKKLLLVFSQATLEELFDVLARPELGQTKLDLSKLRQLLKTRDRVRVVKPKYRVTVVKEDDTDNRFLECANRGKAVFLVSNDAHLLDVKEYKNTRILTTAQFLALFGKN